MGSLCFTFPTGRSVFGFVDSHKYAFSQVPSFAVDLIFVKFSKCSTQENVTIEILKVLDRPCSKPLTFQDFQPGCFDKHLNMHLITLHHITLHFIKICISYGFSQELRYKLNQLNQLHSCKNQIRDKVKCIMRDRQVLENCYFFIT